MCNSTSRCHICQKPHHTLLHRDENKQINQSTKSTKNVILVSTKKETKNRTASSGLESEVLLATALVKVKTVSGSSKKLRILIDPGSQASFITEEAANLLAHPRQKIHAKISGLEDGSPKISKWKVDLNVQPHFPSNFTLNTTFLILSKLTQSLPNKNLPISSDEHWNNKILADPTYNIPGPIDAIIGAEECGKIIQDGIHKAEHRLLGQKTEFGWILSGTMKEKPATTIISMINRVEEDAQLKKFWEIEEVLVPRIQTKEDADCEDHYQNNTKRNEDGTYTVTIPFKTEPEFGESKRRAVARTKSTLPRLELCAAVLLARLFKRTTRTLKLDQETPLFAWSDSTITLAWITEDPTKWKTFVANRVIEINNTISKEHWHYVSGEENPADIISRGIHLEKLVQHQVWWNGPSWLLKERCWPQQEEIENTNEEMKIPRIIACVKAIDIPKEYERFSSLTKMIRVLSYCRRFITNCSNKAKEHGQLTVHEMNTTLNVIIIEIQNRKFEMEIKSLRKNNQVDKKSKLSTLNPFIDKEGLLRVGGRLQKSPLAYDEKHPIIIPYHSQFSQMLIQNAHASTLHGGNQATLAYIRRKYWIINGKT
ncbi:uncharacterized protein [Onthophagus taurus]|uniref:uncharacterized protein n=1 Tax=Onthophagus taurus TaxID=166361 RepID=UPI0039BDB4B4